MKRITKLLYYIFVFFIEVSTLLLVAVTVYNLISMPAKKITFYLPQSNVKTILKTLNTYGYPTYTVDNFILKFMTLPKEGWYTVSGEEGRFFFFKTLHTKHAKTMQIELFAGETSTELTKRLANDMNLNQRILLKKYNQLTKFKEGDILAGRYTIAKCCDENTTISHLFKISNSKFNIFSRQYLSTIPNKTELKKLLTIASIIQKESNSIDEMPLISSVIYNRLEKNMRLQMDGTLNYGEYSHTIVTPERIKTDESFYNTYKHKGLPPTPLSTVSLNALKSACYPEKTDYLFFMLDMNGTHNFTTTYKEHLKKVRSFKKELRQCKKEKKNIDNNISSTSSNSDKKIFKTKIKTLEKITKKPIIKKKPTIKKKFAIKKKPKIKKDLIKNKKITKINTRKKKEKKTHKREKIIKKEYTRTIYDIIEITEIDLSESEY